MSDLVQVVYVSRATFKPMPTAAGGVEPHVARILQQSRANNPRLGLGGVLYYGEGSFFQCLEGERPVVEALIEKLRMDDRHKDFRIIHQVDIKERQFTDWSMKYIPTSDVIKGILKQAGYQRFDPYQFDEAMVRKLLKTFRELNAEGAGAGSGNTQEKASVPASASPLPFVLAGVVIVILLVVVGVFVL